MAKMKTSISEDAARRLANKSPEEKLFLFCKRIAGLHLKNLQKKGAASWRYRYKDAFGKRRVFAIGKYPAVGTAEAAEMALEMQTSGGDPFQQREKEKRRQRKERALAAARTFSSYLEGAYAAHQKRKKSGDETLRNLRHSFAEFLDYDMAALRDRDVRQWQERKEAEGLAFATIQRAFGALKTMLNHAARQDPPIIESNPLENVRLERHSESEREKQLKGKREAERRLLTASEKQGLFVGLAAFNDEKLARRLEKRRKSPNYAEGIEKAVYAHWFVPFTTLAFYTGLRTGDLYSLTWRELNINFRRLTKEPEKTKHTPNPASVQMDLSGNLLDVMKDWWKQCGKPLDGLVFPSERLGEGSTRMDKSAHRKAWKRVKELGGLPSELAFYSLRHNFISTLVANPAWSLHDVARLAGHKSTAMIEKHYGHLSARAKASAIAEMENTVAMGCTKGNNRIL